MKIALVCRVYTTHRPGGMPHVCADRAEELARQGHDVRVFTTAHQDKGFGGGAVNGVGVHHFKCAAMEYTDEFAEACKRACMEFEPDILHLDSVDRARPWWKSRPGNPKSIGVTMHGFGMGAFLTDWNLWRSHPDDHQQPQFNHHAIAAEAYGLAEFDRVCAISLHEQTMLEDCYGLTNVSLVYNPIPAYFFDRPTVPPPEKRRFLCAAISGQSTRMFHVAQEAARQAGVELVVANDVPRDKMPELYDGVTALVVPTCYAQGYDLTVAEALARNRPVILSQTGSYYREFRDAYTWPGRMVPLGDVDALRDAMLGPLVSPSDLPQQTFGHGLAGRHHPKWHVGQWLKAMSAE